MSDRLLEMHAGEAFGRYELLLPIARGGMSRVWAARLRGTRGFQKLVAIKTLLPSPDERDLLECMLLDEARLASQIQHPNVAQYLDLGERNGVLFVVMEWVEGEALRSLMRLAASRGGIPLELAGGIIAQTCKGLHGAHELRDTTGTPLGLVHCDVSPPNLMIGTNGAVKLIDFGIAKATLGSKPDQMVAGKLAFMAPEQARGEVLDRRADLFALGIILYLLTTGRHPFPGHRGSESLAHMYRSAEVVPPSQIVPNYPQALEDVVLKALRLERSERFGSAEEMLSELNFALPIQASEGELSAFVQEVAGTTISSRREAILDALRTADERHPEASLRSGQPLSLPPSAPPASQTGLPAGTSATDAPVTQDDSAPRPARERRHGTPWSLGATFLLGAIAAAGFSQAIFLRKPLPVETHFGASTPSQMPELETTAPVSARARQGQSDPGSAGVDPLPLGSAPSAGLPSGDPSALPSEADPLRNDADLAESEAAGGAQSPPPPPRKRPSGTTTCPRGKACASPPRPKNDLRLRRRYGI